MNVVVALSTALLLTALSAGAGRGGVAIRVRPAFSIDPADVLVEGDIARRGQNRLLRVSLESGEYYWSSERQLEGDASPRTSAFECLQLPAGSYDVEAQVVGSDGRARGLARSHVSVLPR